MFFFLQSSFQTFISLADTVCLPYNLRPGFGFICKAVCHIRLKAKTESHTWATTQRDKQRLNEKEKLTVHKSCAIGDCKAAAASATDTAFAVMVSEDAQFEYFCDP
jgi:hypothetical protein